MVLDCRHINDYIRVPKCKLEAHETFIKMLEPNSWMISFDLKSGYHHVQMAESQREFLGFSFPDDRGRQRFFHFNSMPFGLSPATLVFTKLLRHFIQMWRSQGIFADIFVDDGIAALLDKLVLCRQAQTIKRGFIRRRMDSP